MCRKCTDSIKKLGDGIRRYRSESQKEGCERVKIKIRGKSDEEREGDADKNDAMAQIA
jgi:hypothetical protein